MEFQSHDTLHSREKRFGIVPSRHYGDECEVPGMGLVKVHEARQLQLFQLFCLALAWLGLLHNQQTAMWQCCAYNLKLTLATRFGTLVTVLLIRWIVHSKFASYTGARPVSSNTCVQAKDEVTNP